YEGKAGRDGAERSGIDGSLRLLENAAPGCIWRWGAEAKIGEGGFGNDGEPELQGEIDRQRRPDIGQDVDGDDLGPGAARGARRGDVIHHEDALGEDAREAGDNGREGDAERDNGRPEAC